jgi:hypothetical protein
VRRSRQNSTLSFDSLLDILSNVVGLMILVAVVTVLNSRDITISLGTPILQDPPERAERILFECHDNRVVYVDEKTIDDQIANCIVAYKKKHQKRPGRGELPELFRRADVGSQNYRVKVEVGRSATSFIYELRKPDLGETVADLHDPQSEYAGIVGSLDPRTYFVFFIVRNDSFEAFRAARRMAGARGLATGWHPRPRGEPLRFRPGGAAGDQIQ